MSWRSVVFLFVFVVTAVACSSSPAGSSCTSAGGTCVLGGARCAKEAATSAQDCNPSENPGGAFCCLDLGDGGSAAPTDAGERDAARDGDASNAAPASSCPAKAPTPGAVCSSTGIACGYVEPSATLGDYGSSVCAIECTYGDDARFACRPDFACIGGAWVVSDPTPGYSPPCSTPPTSSCPATLDAASNADCAAVGAICAYGPSACVCSVCTGGCPLTADGGVPVTWECDAPPTPSGCPAAAPNYGTACSMGDVVCMYGNCYAGTWVEAKCVGGVWRRTDDTCAI